jgi:small-conductance mechanosensitive channel
MNEKFDNTFSNTIVAIVGTVVRTIERSIVVFWDGLRNATIHGTPSLLGFVAAISPVLAPIPIATQTAISLMNFMNWLPFQAVIMAIVIESAGFVLWVFLTEAIMQDGWKGTTTQFVFGGAVLVYQVVLILINVGLAVDAGTRGAMAAILFLACLFPALCSVAYGYNNTHSKAILEQERREMLEQKERERQERREDRRQAQELKLKYAADVKQEKALPFRGKRS